MLLFLSWYNGYSTSEATRYLLYLINNVQWPMNDKLIAVTSWWARNCRLCVAQSCTDGKAMFQLCLLNSLNENENQK